MLVCVGCGIAEIDAVTVPAKATDFAEPDSEISNSMFAIYHVALTAVNAGILNYEVLYQDMAMLVPVRELKRSRCIRIN